MRRDGRSVAVRAHLAPPPSRPDNSETHTCMRRGRSARSLLTRTTDWAAAGDSQHRGHGALKEGAMGAGYLTAASSRRWLAASAAASGRLRARTAVQLAGTARRMLAALMIF